MASARAVLQVHIDGITDESIPLTVRWVNQTAVGESDAFDLSSGNNSFTRPTNAKYALFIPPAANGVVLAAKGATGDGNTFTLVSNEPNFFAVTATTLVINAVSGVTGCRLWWI